MVRLLNLPHTLFEKTGITALPCCYRNTANMTAREICYSSAI